MFLYNTNFERFNRNVIVAVVTQISIDEADGIKFKFNLCELNSKLICVKQTGGYKDQKKTLFL
jgi:hypothetical protein